MAVHLGTILVDFWYTAVPVGGVVGLSLLAWRRVMPTLVTRLWRAHLIA